MHPVHAIGFKGSEQVVHEISQAAQDPVEARAVPLGQTQDPPNGNKPLGQAVQIVLFTIKHEEQGKSHGPTQTLVKLKVPSGH